MLKKISALAFCLISFFCSTSIAADLIHKKGDRDIALRKDTHQITYKDIIGMKDGLYRSLTTINGKPGLYVGSRDDFYYTLKIVNDSILIDCMYSNVRNKYMNSMASAGVCKLNIPLDKNYYELTYLDANKWQDSIFSFDTQPILKTGNGADYLLGKIGEVEIFDRYPSVDAIINSSPQKVIKSPAGCFNFGSDVGYLIFLNTESSLLHYLDILRSKEPIRFQRLGASELKALAVDKCVALENNAG